MAGGRSLRRSARPVDQGAHGFPECRITDEGGQDAPQRVMKDAVRSARLRLQIDRAADVDAGPADSAPDCAQGIDRSANCVAELHS